MKPVSCSEIHALAEQLESKGPTRQGWTLYGWYGRWFLMPWKWRQLLQRRRVYRHHWKVP